MFRAQFFNPFNVVLAFASMSHIFFHQLVIGTMAKGDDGVSLALILGVFLSNFPEAMSSSVGMKKAGMSTYVSCIGLLVDSLSCFVHF